MRMRIRSNKHKAVRPSSDKHSNPPSRPQQHQPVEAGSRELLRVARRSERELEDARLPVQLLFQSAALTIPDAKLAAARSRRDPPAIGAEGQTAHATAMPGEVEDGLARLEVDLAVERLPWRRGPRDADAWSRCRRKA